MKNLNTKIATFMCLMFFAPGLMNARAQQQDVEQALQEAGNGVQDAVDAGPIQEEINDQAGVVISLAEEALAGAGNVPAEIPAPPLPQPDPANPAPEADQVLVVKVAFSFKINETEILTIRVMPDPALTYDLEALTDWLRGLGVIDPSQVVVSIVDTAEPAG